MLAPIVAYWDARVASWKAIPDDLKITIGLAVLAVLLLALAIWWLWWRLPKREAARLALKIRDPKARADVEDNYRKTIGQGLGGIAFLLGAGLAYLQFSQQQRASDLQSSRQQQASHDLLISGQVSKGFEQLGSEKVVIRLGGIYALEGVMNGSDQYHQPVLEALTAFVREGTLTEGHSLPTDIQAALAVIGRRSVGPRVDQINLSGANLSGADLFHADLRLADLTAADLSHANLIRANLTRADLGNYANLTRAHLNGIVLDHANLTDANLDHANLTDANLDHANLDHANLTGGHLEGANLDHANLTRADLIGAGLTRAHLTDAELTRADLTDAELTRADLTGARIDQKQLDEACGSDAKLPLGLTLKPCPPKSPP
jgi:uncharacterized protein YjbI with pentapeptide repeats